jgi:hypothetical protein
VTVSRPAGLQAGAEVRLGGHVLAVTAVTGTSVQFRDVTGQVSKMPLAAVLGGRASVTCGASRSWDGICIRQLSVTAVIRERTVS